MADNKTKIWGDLTEHDFETRTYSVDGSEETFTLGQMLESNLSEWIENGFPIKEFTDLSTGETLQHGIHAASIKRLS